MPEPPATSADPSNNPAPVVADPDVVFQSSTGDDEGVTVPWPEPWSMDGQTPYIQRFGLGYRFGDGPDFREKFTDFEWTIPFRGDSAFDHIFADLHFLLDNDAKVGGNATLAFRRYLLDRNRIIGGYVFWDGTRSPMGNEMQQMGVGVESLGTIFDVRANLYIPDRFDTRYSLTNVFRGNNLIINRAEVAMTGIDAEVGLNLPVYNSTRTRIFGGGYNFDGQGTNSTAGWKVRTETEFNRQLWVDVSCQGDRLFGHTWNLGLVWRYSHRLLGDKPAAVSMDHKYFRADGVNATYDISDRLSDPIRRLQHVIITQDRGQIATNTTGTRINFLHVKNGATGTGTIENPLGTLSSAMASTNAGTSVIYTPAGGTFNENLTLTSGARLLSNGPVQTVATQLGNQRLPFSGAHPNMIGMPRLTGNVTMANNATFSGFDVSGGVTASAATGFTIDNSVVTNSAGDAISITGATASTLKKVQVSSSTGRGVFLNDSAAAITDLTIKNAGTNGLEVTSATTARTVTIDKLKVEAATGHGVDLNVGGTGALTFTQTGTANIKSTGTAFDAALNAGSTGALNLTLATLTAASSSGAGINLDGSGGSGALNLIGLTSGTITEAATGGFNANKVTFDSGLSTPGIQQLTATSLKIGTPADLTKVKGDGLHLINTTGDLSITTLAVFNDTGSGVFVDNSGASTTMALATAGGTISTSHGPALSLNKLTAAMTLGSIKSTNSPTNGVLMDAVSGALTVTETTLNDSIGKAILIRNTPAAMAAKFGTTNIHSTISTLQSDNVDTTTNNGTNLNLDFTTITITGP